MSRVLILSVLVSALLIFGAYRLGNHANAQSSVWGCKPQAEAVKSLEWEFGERLVAMGQGFPSNRQIQLFVSDSGNFTVLGTGLDGKGNLISCKAVKGSSWVWHRDFYIGQRS